MQKPFGERYYTFRSVRTYTITMKLYLMQHGESVSKEVDLDRPLTTRGERDVRQVADFMKQAGVSVNRILHSGKTRARQTAEILASVLLADGNIAAIEGIAPNDPVESFAATIIADEADLLIVGHLPFLARLVSWLITYDADQPLVACQPGSVICLEQNESLNWQIIWMVRPDCFHHVGH